MVSLDARHCNQVNSKGQEHDTNAPTLTMLHTASAPSLCACSHTTASLKSKERLQTMQSRCKQAMSNVYELQRQ
jgi:hypothetical protein